MELTEKEIKELSNQLSRPSGEFGDTVALRMNESNKEMTQKTFEVLNFNNESSLLEIGPGNGELSRDIIRKLDKGSYLAVEPSNLMAKKLSEGLGSDFSNVEVFNGEFNSFKSEKKFDAIFSVNVLYFIEDLEELFKKALSLLANGAQAVFSYRTKETLEQLPISKYNFILRDQEDIEEVLKKCGIKSYKFIDHIESGNSKRQVEVDFIFKNQVLVITK